jgi:two-component system response regulator HydG
METNMTDSMKHFTSFADTLPCGLFTLDENFMIKTWNNQMHGISGYEDKLIIGKKLDQIQFFDLNDTINPFDFIQCMMHNRHGEFHNTMYIKTSGDSLKLVYINAMKTSDYPGTGIAAILSLTDISNSITCDPLQLNPSQERPASFYSLVGKTAIMQNLYEMIKLASDSMANILISGDSGTGKELVARAVHFNSLRRDHPFISVNCSALPETLLESELFGHVKGSFTGAYRDKTGKFEMASGGTIFLDEIGEISQLIQVKLLRVIQEKKITKVGDTAETAVDMRIIAATNRDLWELVQEGTFREDLYYRLKVFPITTVALKERKNDIPLLVAHFVEKFNKSTGKHILGFSDDAMRLIMEYCWPGNVRELENCIEHAFVLCKNEMIDVFDLPQEIRMIQLRDGVCSDDLTGDMSGKSDTDEQAAPVRRRNTVSRDQLLDLLNACNWNRSETARKLGISRVALWKKMKKFKIDPPEDN